MTQTHIKLDAAIVAAMIKAREIGVKMLASDCEQILSAAGIDGQFMDCGHHKSLLLTSAETGEPLYCEYCDMRDQRNDLLASAPEVGEAGTDKVERNYVYEDGIEPGYDKEPAVILALRNTELQKRVEQLEDLLSSAYNIANRNGEDTHWFRFAAQLHTHGISPVTSKTFKILQSDECYQPDRIAQLEADKARLVEVKSELAKVREQLYKVSGSALLAGEKCKKEDAGILYNIVCTANNTLCYIETLIADMEAKG